ncbi:hypothetical protein [Aquimarina celericrescens]|uniref:hypothetical protein n=1 Tax=Aquimarina celericrescens TaxID=1964542 RepID=UPI001B7734FD|nr:hypothetical protein [Aquimarina celericrescens]
MKILNVKRVKTISKLKQRSISGGNAHQDCVQWCIDYYSGQALMDCWDDNCAIPT